MKLKTCVRTLLLAVLLFPGLVMADFFKKSGTFESSMTLDEAVRLDVDTGSGSIDVRAGSGNEVTIKGVVKVRKGGFWGKNVDADELLQQVQDDPPIELDGGRLKVGHFSDRNLRKRVSVSYEIVVPANTEVVADTGSGSIMVVGIDAPVNADTGSGSITLENIAGTVRTDTGSGSITLEGVSGSISADTGSGAIRASAITGSFHADTGSGSISVEGHQDGKWSLDTGSGSVSVDLPDDAAFDFDAKSNSGKIVVDHPMTMQGEISKKRVKGEVRGGGPLLHIDTGSGGIRVE
jgi:DUF4097 and DUF4098 domain-containing protein YvlB